MKKKLLLLLFLLAGGNAAYPADVTSLSTRLSFYKPQSCRETVLLLQSQFADTFTPPAQWQQTIDELESQKQTLLKGLKENNAPAVEATETLLKKLDAIFLSNPLVANKAIVVIKRELGNKSRHEMGGGIGVAPSNFQNNSEIRNPRDHWNNQLMELRIAATGPPRRTLLMTPPKGMIITDPEPHWDGRHILYSSIGTNNHWQLFELDTQTGRSRQVTPDSYKDFDSFDGCYVPGGGYIFCSTATFMGLPCTNGGNKMCGLFHYDPKTGTTRQLTFDQDSNWGPTLMNNGQVLYQRWEYADLPHSNSRFLFSMNPDGTSQRNYWGRGCYFPASFFGAKAVLGHASAVIGVATGHHSVSRSGRLLLIDPEKGMRDTDGVLQEIPYKGKKIDPIARDRLPDGIYPQFLTPCPLNLNFHLVSMKPAKESLWGLYLVDTNDNVTLIAEQEGAAFIEPNILETKRAVPTIPSQVKIEEKTATLFMQDIYVGDGLKGIPRGTVKRLRIGSYNFSPWQQGGLLGTIGMDGPWDVKRILGTVEVEEDGSAMFTVPANTPIFVQPLDAEGKALQAMRSWFTAMPGETQACVGCHETRHHIPLPKPSLASKRPPQPIREWRGRARGFSYRHEVQPVLDKRCVACHDGSNEKLPYLKGDRWIDDWRSDISGHAEAAYGGRFTQSYAHLHRYVRRSGIESDMQMLAPMDVHADQTELMQMLNKGHKNVKLTGEEIEILATWIDFNAPFHGRRSDIPQFDKTCHSNDLRQKYAAMLHAPVVDSEWLPDIPQNIVPLRPEKGVYDKGPDTLSGFPWYDPCKTPYGARSKVIDRQIDLGHIRQRIEIAPNVMLELMQVPPGEFLMGGTNHPDEMPRAKVTIDKPFWIGKFEITNAQFKAFDPLHESRDEHRHGYQFGRKGYSMDKPDQPAVRLSWSEAMAFCQWLSKKTGKNFTLPTEAEWEWACRSGSATDFWFGTLTDDFSRYANLGDIRLRDFADCTAFKFYEGTALINAPSKYDDWIPRDTTYNDGGFISEEVGRYIPNGWELYDMHGNVAEWTLSEYRSYPYDNNDGRNNTEVGGGKKRVVRGGSWYDRPKRATSSFRIPYRDYQKVFNVGFRVVMTE